MASLVSAPHRERHLLCCFRGDTPYNGLYGEASAPPERGTFSRLLVYERIGKSVDFLKVLYFSPGSSRARSLRNLMYWSLLRSFLRTCKRSTCSKSRKSVILVCKKAQKGYQMGFMPMKKSRRRSDFGIYSYLKVGRSQEYNSSSSFISLFYSKFNRIRQVVRRGDLKKPPGLYREATSIESSDLETWKG